MSRNTLAVFGSSGHFWALFNVKITSKIKPTIMSYKDAVLNPIYFKKKITSAFHLAQLNILEQEWGISKTKCCARILEKGIALEKERLAKAKAKKTD